MARAALKHFALTLSTTALLMGCVEGAGSGGSGGSTPGIAAAPASRGATREVEAPEVFQATDSALWDGRPSLGGIWVASPDATDPERVVMFNPATGKSVTGALFRRERDNPGPKLQISSDAAEALGILAGQPTELRVTALRKEEVAEPAPEATEVEAPAGEAEETAALAAAALDATEAAPEAAAASAAPDAAAGTAEAGAGAAAVVADPTAAEEAPKRKTWKERRAEAKARREAERAAKAAAAAAAAAAPEGEGVDPAAGSVAVIETAPLDARPPETLTEAPAAVPAAAPEAPAASTGGRPIQIASFSKEENARRAAEALAKAGITAQPQKSERDGKPVWGVVAMGDAALLAKIKAAGFADAYFLR